MLKRHSLEICDRWIQGLYQPSSSILLVEWGGSILIFVDVERRTPLSMFGHNVELWRGETCLWNLGWLRNLWASGIFHVWDMTMSKGWLYTMENGSAPRLSGLEKRGSCLEDPGGRLGFLEPMVVGHGCLAKCKSRRCCVAVKVFFKCD